MKEILYKHIRYHNQLIGTIAISKDQIGVAIFNPKDLEFNSPNKKDGRWYARQNMGKELTVPNRDVCWENNTTTKVNNLTFKSSSCFSRPVKQLVDEAVESAKESARKYFKDQCKH